MGQRTWVRHLHRCPECEKSWYCKGEWCYGTDWERHLSMPCAGKLGCVRGEKQREREAAERQQGKLF